MKLLFILLVENYSLPACSQEHRVIQLSLCHLCLSAFWLLEGFFVFCSLTPKFPYHAAPAPCQHVSRLPILPHVAVVLSALCGHGTLKTWFIHCCQPLLSHWPNEHLVTIDRRR